MEKRKLTKEDIDKVRDIEGFPIGTDEDIIALSDAPYYTACPNPFIEDFIKENGTPYDEETDDYHREPFAADVSEGKSDPIYMAHSYHTKVPYKAIKRYILHYTNPGDIILDAYCGTGMTGVAAQDCKKSDEGMISFFDQSDENNIGERKVILNDLSPVATFISYNCNKELNTINLNNEINEWLSETEKNIKWVYITHHTDGREGKIGYTVWSQTVICPHCGKNILYYDLVTQNGAKSSDRIVSCPHCNVKSDKASFQRSIISEYDDIVGEQVNSVEKHPVKIFYSIDGKTYEKAPDDYDLEVIEKISKAESKWYPIEQMMFKGTEWGEVFRSGVHVGISRVHHFFSKRNLIVLSELFENANHYKNCSSLKELIIASLGRASMRNRYIPEYGNRHVGTLSGTLYIPPISEENNLVEAIKGRANRLIKASSLVKCNNNNYIISTGSVTDLPIPDESVDYIFTDPPFGDNLIYSELNFISESWLKVYTNNQKEAIICGAQQKTINEYNDLMKSGFREYFRVLKPNRWITVEFHNSQNAVWNGIQESLQAAGFVIADVRILDKQKGTTKQLSYTMAVKQDLVISAYKPNSRFKKEIIKELGTEDSSWSFVRQHLANLPIVVKNNNRIEVVNERQAFLLFDRMVAYHIMNGLPVPIDASNFYKGLDERFLKRDNMYFLPNQVNEYDIARITNEVEDIEFSLFVNNEKTAISWLYQQLSENGNGPQTYAEIQPKFMQEVKSVEKYEQIPELSILLDENFLKDNSDRWYIPDRTKEADVAKLREKNLLKEFDGYLNSKGKLKLFRSEAVRAGFKKLWQDKNYQAIVNFAERLPEQVVQEDQNLLMYYDVSLSRIKG